ncbi:MAG TPA: hypothetical protein VGE51_01775, partial [Fontimonas sp.]
MNTFLGRAGARRLTVGLALLLSACAGEYDGGVAGGGNGPDPTGGSFTSVNEFYTQRIEPRLAFCRTCHLPGKVADVEDGRLFMLSPDGSNDFAALKASWEALGGNKPTSRILLMASGQELPHSGGQPWAQGSAPYNDMATLLRCFENPDGCLA